MRLREGDLKLRHSGKKLKGGRPSSGSCPTTTNRWGLIQKSGKVARAPGAKREGRLVVSGRTMEQISLAADAVWAGGKGNRATGKKKPKKKPVRRKRRRA